MSCPRCANHLSQRIVATGSEWVNHCPVCRVRYNKQGHLHPMHTPAGELHLTRDQANYLYRLSGTQRRQWASLVLRPEALMDIINADLPEPITSFHDAVASGDVETACALLADEMNAIQDA